MQVKLLIYTFLLGQKLVSFFSPNITNGLFLGYDKGKPCICVVHTRLNQVIFSDNLRYYVG